MEEISATWKKQEELSQIILVELQFYLRLKIVIKSLGFQQTKLSLLRMTTIFGRDKTNFILTKICFTLLLEKQTLIRCKETIRTHRKFLNTKMCLIQDSTQFTLSCWIFLKYYAKLDSQTWLKNGESKN